MTGHHPFRILCAALVGTGLSAAVLAQGTGAMGQSTAPSNASGATSAPSTQKTSAPMSPTGKAAASLSHGDKDFVEDTARDGMTEIELGKLAQQHAASDQVKQFGARMIQDHGKAGDDLNRIAESKGLKMPTEPSMMQRHDVTKLSKLNGADFDKAYTDAMVKDHEKAVKTFTKESTDAKDPEVRSFAAKTLPTLKEHLQLAQAAQQAVGGKK
jgi:putative membrane protein